MAYSNFYIQSGGNNLNAGSTTDNTAVVTETNGNWDSATRIFTPVAGTPFSGVVAGEWASILLDAATTQTYTAEIASVNGGGASITLHATNKFGTAPSTGATGRTARVGGAWADPAVLDTNNLGDNTAKAVNTKVNIKAATYSISASPLYRFHGNVGVPVWFSGYNTTPGDLDEDTTNSLSKPIFSYSAGNRVQSTGGNVLWTSIEFTANVDNTAVTVSSDGPTKMMRCRVINTSSGNSARGISCDPFKTLLAYCYITTASTVAAAAWCQATYAYGCVFEAGGNALQYWSDSMFIRCICYGATNDGALSLNSFPTAQFFNCTFKDNGRDGLRIAGSSNGYAIIAGCAFAGNNAYGINFNDTTHSTGLIVNNSFYDNTSGQMRNVAESTQFFAVTEGSNPFSGFTPQTGFDTLTGGFPGIVENETDESLPSCGAVQPEAGGGGSGSPSSYPFLA